MGSVFPMALFIFIGGDDYETCSVHQVTKMYGGNTIFSHISFEIKTGDRVGLVGRNGSGKTTLLQLLAGVETPDAGKIH